MAAASLTALVVTLAITCPCGAFPHNKTSELKELSKANTDFGFNLYHKIRDLQNSKNIFFSPWSISQALSMTYAGASANTKTQMAEVLKLKNIQDVHRKLRDLTKGVFQELEGNYTLKQANRLYGSTRFTFKDAFLATLQNMYKSRLEKKNFAMNPDQSRQEINSWVEDQTENKIKDLLPEGSIGSDTALVLINALYCKANWKKPFDPKKTITRNFYVKKIPAGEDEHIAVPMMVHSLLYAKYMYSFEAKFGMLELPYAGNLMSMYIILPFERFGIDSVAEYLSADNIQDHIQHLRGGWVDVQLPKFKIRATFELKPALEQLGMKDAFSNAADFSSMTDNAVKLDQVYHQAFIDVNEEGTEAAAATGGAAIPYSATPMFIVDHPFLVFIRDNGTGTILFIGEIGIPKSQA